MKASNFGRHPNCFHPILFPIGFCFIFIHLEYYYRIQDPLNYILYSQCSCINYAEAASSIQDQYILGIRPECRQQLATRNTESYMFQNVAKYM